MPFPKTPPPAEVVAPPLVIYKPVCSERISFNLTEPLCVIAFLEMICTGIATLLSFLSVLVAVTTNSVNVFENKLSFCENVWSEIIDTSRRMMVCFM